MFCSHLEHLKTGTFGLTRGLISPKEPRGAVAQFLEAEFQTASLFVTADQVQYAPAAKAARRDVIAWMDGGSMRVGQIMMFFAMKGDPETVAVVSEFGFLRRTSHDAEYSRTSTATTYVFLDTILDVLVYSDCGDTVRVLLSFHTR